MTRYAGRYVLTITPDHVRDPRTLGAHGWRVRQVLSRLLPADIGKQVWETSPGVYQVENDEQLRRRELAR